MKTNYHSHTRYCHHSNLTIEDSVKLHRDHKYNILGISEHAPLSHVKEMFRLQHEEVDEYIKNVRAINEKYDDIEVLCALEAEYLLDDPIHLEYLRSLRKKVDYIVMANHIIGNLKDGNFVHFARHKAEPKHLEENVRLLKQGWDTGLFAFIAHPDSILRMYHWDKHAEKMAHDIGKWAEKSGAILEINSNGIRCGNNRSVEEGTHSYTNLNFWKILSNYKLNVIINGDTHNDFEVGHKSEDIARQIALDYGFTIINKL